MSRKLVIADHSGSNYEFLGVFTKKAIDTVFDWLEDNANANEVTCDLYDMMGRGLEKTGERKIKTKDDVIGIKKVLMETSKDEIRCKVTSVEELGAGYKEANETRLDVSRGSRRRFKVSFSGVHGGLHKITKAAQFGIESQLSEALGNPTQEFRLWINGKSKMYNSGMKNHVKKALKWDKWDPYDY